VREEIRCVRGKGIGAQNQSKEPADAAPHGPGSYPRIGESQRSASPSVIPVRRA
jgi:hypothetical protein